MTLLLPDSTAPVEESGNEREGGQVVIYDRDAAFQRRMINLFWEHFASTSLTYLGLAHTHARPRAGAYTERADKRRLARVHTLHA